MHTFKGCTALITGASAGLGCEFARQLAPHAKTLILVARRTDRLEQLKGEIARPGLNVHVHAANLAVETEVEGLLTALKSIGEPVTLLINNAGLGDHGFFEESEWPRVKAMLDVNIQALTQLTHAFLPGLIKAPAGAILNVSSIASLLPLPKMAVYAATKAYVTSFSEALRAELKGTRVTVTALCPGPVDTEFSSIADRPNSDDKMPAPEIFKVPAAEVVRQALRGVVANQPRVIPGWLVWFVMTITTLVPIFILRLFLGERRKP